MNCHYYSTNLLWCDPSWTKLNAYKTIVLCQCMEKNAIPGTTYSDSPLTNKIWEPDQIPQQLRWI